MRTTDQIRTLAILSAALVWPPGTANAAKQPTPTYVPALATHQTDFRQPPVELRFVLAGQRGGKETVRVRLMRRKGQVTQSFLVPGDHPYVSEGVLPEPTGHGWKGRVLLSRDPRGGPARGMGTPRVARVLEVEIKRDGKELRVRCTSEGQSVPATARAVPWEEIAKQNDPLDASKSWPAWYGPYCNFAAEPTAHALVGALRNARLVWKSQEQFGSGKGQSPRYGVIPADGTRLPMLPSSGGASPVVAHGNVYVYYLMPSGEAVDEKLLEQRRRRAKGKPLGPWEPDLWRIAADDCIACIDGRTGQTRWRTVYKGAGANWHDSKAGPCNVTPCLWKGKIYAIGSTGRVYCLDAATGREVWQSSIGRRHFAIEAAKTAALAQRRYGKLTFNRDFGGAPTVVGGVVVMPDFTSHGACGLLAFDAETGQRLWHIPRAAAEDAVPLRYARDGQQFVLSAVAGTQKDQPGRVVCVEPKTGKIRWSITKDIRGNSTTMSIWKDYLIVHAPGEGKLPVATKKPPIAMACFAISPDGYKPLWKLPLDRGCWSEHPPAVADGRVFARLIGAELLCIDVATGKVVASAPYGACQVGATMVYADGRLIVDRDGSHSGTELTYFAADPKRGTLRPLGKPWPPPHQHGTSYHPPCSHPYVDGRLFLRGGDGVYCYDLRKRVAGR